MFYSQDLLQKRGGKFGIVWIAATRSKMLSRREYMSVRVRRTCDDIVDYILLRVQGTAPGRARPRFSIYLSSTLMYGACKVFQKQHDFLFDDVSTLWSQLRFSGLKSSTFDIDLKLDPTKPDLPNLVGKSDPFSVDYEHGFGVWDSPLHSAKPYDMALWLEGMTTPIKEPEIKSTPQTPEEMIKEALASPHTVSCLEDIRMKDDQSMMVEEIKIDEKELPGFDGKEITMVTDQMDEVPIEIADLMLPRKTRSRSTSSMSDILPIIPEETHEIPEVLPPVLETPEKKQPEVRETTVASGTPTTPVVTPVPPPREGKRKKHRLNPNLQLHLEDVDPVSRPRKKRRRLRFIDVHTQITKKQIKQNMITSSDICMTNLIPATKRSTVEDLFALPGKKQLCHPKLLPLWTRNAVTHCNGETEDDKQDPSWTTSDLLRIQREVDEVRLQRPKLKLSPILDEAPEPEIAVPAVDLSNGDIPAAPHLSSSSDSDNKSPGPRKSVEQDEELRKGQEQDSIEVAREGSMLSLHQSVQKDASSINIEHSRHSMEQSGQVSALDDSILSRSRSRGWPTRLSFEEEPIVEMVPEPESVPGVLPPLQTVEEEVALSPKKQDYCQEMIGHIDQRTVEKNWTRFRTICGTENTFRHYAAKMFNALLELSWQEITICKQKESYADIYISRGPKW